MAASNIAILYWTASTIMWGKVVADTDAEIAYVQANLQPGTSCLLIPAGPPYDDDACRAAIARSTGKPTPHGICDVIGPDGSIVGAIHVDHTMNDATISHGPGHSYKPRP